MAFKIDFTKDAVKSFSRLSEDIKIGLKDKIVWLADNSDNIIHRKLKGNYYSEVFKLRFGNYRILYRINKTNKTITIETVGHRKSIYK